MSIFVPNKRIGCSHYFRTPKWYGQNAVVVVRNVECKTGQMNIGELCDLCLSLPSTTEAIPFEKFPKGRLTIPLSYSNYVEHREVVIACEFFKISKSIEKI